LCADFLDVFVIDYVDVVEKGCIEELGVKVVVVICCEGFSGLRCVG
jgi:hypothetical protein